MRGPASSIRGPKSALALRTRGGSRVPELGTLGSVRGALSNERPYRDPLHFELRFLGGNRETAGLEHEWIGRAFSPTFLAASASISRVISAMRSIGKGATTARIFCCDRPSQPTPSALSALTKIAEGRYSARARIQFPWFRNRR
jgi:hypothetical protein